MKKQYDKTIGRARRRPEGENTHRFTQNDTKEISKHQAMMEYMDSVSRNLPPLKRIDAYKEHTYPNGCLKEGPH